MRLYVINAIAGGAIGVCLKPGWAYAIGMIAVLVLVANSIAKS